MDRRSSRDLADRPAHRDIDIRRPPDHQQLRLANAQVAWLGGDGAAPGPTVRPPAAYPAQAGPQVATAGVRNVRSAAMPFAFADHAQACPADIRLVVHRTALEQSRPPRR